MSGKKWTHKSLIVAAGLAVALLMPAVSAAANTNDASDARAGTARYHRLDAARAAGYDLLTDAAGIACIDNPGVGGMGIHYANGNLVGNPSVNAATPEALVYEPQPSGRLRLVAAEYVVLQSAWEAAGNSGVPTLFGRSFELIPSPNRYGLPAFYELHAWIWKHNPRGMFDDWNPLVSCAAAQY
jgi:hypothetical protein